MIFATSETGSIDYNQVLETSAQTLRLSVNGLKTFVKWEGETIPTSINELTTKEGPYTYEEIITILATLEWSEPIEEI
jgi:hypothetical protein